MGQSNERWNRWGDAGWVVDDGYWLVDGIRIARVAMLGESGFGWKRYLKGLNGWVSPLSDRDVVLLVTRRLLGNPVTNIKGGAAYDR